MAPYPQGRWPGQTSDTNPVESRRSGLFPRVEQPIPLQPLLTNTQTRTRFELMDPSEPHPNPLRSHPPTPPPTYDQMVEEIPKPKPELPRDKEQIIMFFLIPVPAEDSKRVLLNGESGTLTVGHLTTSERSDKTALRNFLDAQLPKVERIKVIIRLYKAFDKAGLQEVKLLQQHFANLTQTRNCAVETIVESLCRGWSEEMKMRDARLPLKRLKRASVKWPLSRKSVFMLRATDHV